MEWRGKWCNLLPGFVKNLRFIAEYTGDNVNVNFDWKLWKHLLIQSSL